MKNNVLRGILFVLSIVICAVMLMPGGVRVRADVQSVQHQSSEQATLPTLKERMVKLPRSDVKNAGVAAPLQQGNNECSQDGNSCFSTDGIKVNAVSVNANGEVQISGHVDFTATLEYKTTGVAGEIQQLSAGDFTEIFGPFSQGSIFKFDIFEGPPGNPGSERFPDYMDGGPYTEEFGYRVYVKEGDQRLDIGQGAYDWEGKTGDEIFASFILGYFRNLGEGRDLGYAKHKTGSPWGAAVHEWGGYLVQDFTGSGGDVNNVVMVYNHDRCRTYAVSRHEIMMTYLDAGGPGGWLGAPVTDEYDSGGSDTYEYLYLLFWGWFSEIYPIQRFEHGFISTEDGTIYSANEYHPTGGNIDLYVYTTEEDKGRVYISLDVVPMPGFPNNTDPVEVYITGGGEGDIWPMERRPNGRYYGAYGYDFDFGETAQLAVVMWRSTDWAQGTAPRNLEYITIPIERGYERNGIDILPDDFHLILDIDCSDPEDENGQWCPGPPELIVVDEDGEPQPWDYIARDTLYLQFKNVPDPNNFTGTVTSKEAQIEVAFEPNGFCQHQASVPGDDILSQAYNEVAVLSWDSDTTLGEELLEGVANRGIAAGTGDESNHIPPSSEDFFRAGGFETLEVSAKGVTQYAFMQNQADLIIYTGHGWHEGEVALIKGCVNDGNSWTTDECTLAPDDIGDAWDIDANTVLLFACSILDVNDYNGNWNDDGWLDHDNPFGREQGPVDKVFPGEKWAEIPGPGVWLGFNAAAPLMAEEYGDNVITMWMRLWKDNQSTPISDWQIAVDAHRPWANNACAIDHINYYYLKRWTEWLEEHLEWTEVPRSEWQPAEGETLQHNKEIVANDILIDDFDHYFNTLDIILNGTAELHVYGLSGEHVGPIDGDIELEIPGSHYEVLEDGSVYVQIDSSDLALGYTIQVKGLGTGMANLQVRVPDLGKGHIRSAVYFNVPVSDSSIHQLVLDREQTIHLMLDLDGDGIFESEKLPDDIFRPRTAHSPGFHLCGDRGSTEWFVSEVEANLNIIDPYAIGIEYNLGDGWQSYVHSIPINQSGRTDFEYRLLAADGNPLHTQRASLQIDQEPPTSTLSLIPTLPPSGIYNTDVTIILAGTDNGPSSLDSLLYKINGGSWTTYNADNPPIITQNGINILEYAALDLAGNIEPPHILTITLDKTVHTIIPLDDSQTNHQMATQAAVNAMLDNKLPLLATTPFTVTPTITATVYPTGTLIVQGKIEGDFSKQAHVGPLDLPPAWALYPQTLALFESASLDERASWELPDLRRVLETYLWLHEWPIVNETDIASDTVSADIIFFPAGVTPDVLVQFQESGAAAAALPDQAAQGRWFVFQGDAARLAEQAGLVPTGTVETNALEPGVSSLTPVQPDSILTFNWPEDMILTRYSDAPRFNVTADVVRVADYIDNDEAAIIMRRIGNGGVILIGGHASLEQISYMLLHNAWFAAGAEQVGSHVSVEQQFMPGTPPDIVPGFEADVPVLIRTITTNYGENLVSDFMYTEIVTSGYHLMAPPIASKGTVFTNSLVTGTMVTWSIEELLPGEHELHLLVANVATDTLKPGNVIASQASFEYAEMEDGATARMVHLLRPDAIVRALPPALLAHNFTDEPDNFYPLPPDGAYIHMRHDLENKLETRANNTAFTITLPFFDIIRDAYDQTIFPYTEGTQENVWVLNEIYGYPGRNYPIPVGAADQYWYYAFEDWNCDDWVRIPNPRHIPVSIPPEIQEFAYQEPNNGDIWVAGKTLVFDLKTMLPYDQREPAIRYMIHSQELYGRSVSFSIEPITDTFIIEGGLVRFVEAVVLEGNGGSVYTAVGQHPVPFREYLDDAAINNPIAPVPSQITYTDLWGRPHSVTETVRSSFYDIIPYARTGDAVDVNFVSTYGLNDPDGHRLFDWPTYQVVTLTVAIRAESVNRALSEGQMLIQEMLPRGLGYDIEFIDWEASHDSFQLVDEYVARFPAFDLLYFQGTLPENEPQNITVTARLRVYEGHPHEGSTLVDGGATIASLNEWGNPSQYDTSMTHVRVEQGYESSLGLEKWILSPDISRHGGPTYEIIRLDGSADVERFAEEVYIDSTGTINETAVVRVGGSRGPNLYFGTVQPGGKTMLVMEVINSSGQDWHSVDLSYSAPAGFSLSPILTDGLEPPPNVFDTPYLWAEDIPDMARGVYYYEVQVDESVLPGVMYPIVFTLNGENVPGAAEFPLPVARVGVGGDVQRTLGQAHGILLYDSSPTYAEPLIAKGMTGEQLSTLQILTDTEAIDAFFEALTLTVPVTSHVPLSSTTRLISYTIPAGWQTLPIQDGSEILPDRYLMVHTQVGPIEPGTRLINDGPQADYQDDFGQAWTILGNPTHAIAHGPALTSTYSIYSVTSPFYGGQVVDPIPGEEVDVCIDIAVRNIGNYVATDPIISTTVNLTSEVEIIKVIPAPTSVTSGVITWERPAILPYGASENPDADVDHLQVCLRFTPPDPELLLAMLQDMPFYVPLLEGAQARYMDEWGEQPFIIRSSLGSEFGMHVGGDPLPSPNLYNVTLRDEGVVRLNWTAVPGARDYVVYRSTKRDRDFRPVGTVTNGTELVDIIWDDPLAPLYFYVVRARDANQVEGRHSQVQVVQVGDWPFNVYLPLVLK